MATACLTAFALDFGLELPMDLVAEYACIISLTFWLNVFLDFPVFSGICLDFYAIGSLSTVLILPAVV